MSRRNCETRQDIQRWNICNVFQFVLVYYINYMFIACWELDSNRICNSDVTVWPMLDTAISMYIMEHIYMCLDTHISILYNHEEKINFH